MKVGSLLCLGAASCLLVGCSGPPRIDATSSASCGTSMRKVSDAASKTSDSAAFAAAILRIAAPVAMRSLGSSMAGAFSSLSRASARSVDPPGVDSATMIGSLCDGLAGLSAKDILTGVDTLARRVSVAFDRRYASAYLAALSAAKTEFSRVRDSLAAFKVESARLEQGRGFIGLETTIILSVLNGTAHTVKRAFFSSEAVSDGREVPWIQEEFNHSIPGGLAPGERATWRLQPNMFSGSWNSVRVPRDARFVVQVTKLVGPDDLPLWGGAQFTPGDQRVLDSLSRIVPKK